MNRKILITLCLVIVMSVGLMSCSSGDSSTTTGDPSSTSSQSGSTTTSGNTEEPVTVRVALFSDGNDMSETQKTVFDSFVEEYPNIHPQFEYITSDSYGSNWNGYLMKIQTMIAGNDAPDIIALGLEGVALLAMKDMALPMNDFLDSHKEEFAPIIDAQNEDLIKIFQIDGKTYGIPYESNDVVTHINKEIFAEAGIDLPGYDWTWDDFVEICDKLKASDVEAYPFANTSNFFCYQALLYCNGGSPLNDDWSASTFNSEANIRTTQFFQDAIFVNEYAPEPSTTITDTELMIQGRVAMIWSGRWVSDDYNSSEFFDKVYVNTMPNGGGGNTSCAGTACFVTLNTTEHPDEAMTVATWCAGETYAKTFLSTGSLPANFEAGAEICAASDTIDNWEVMYEIYNNGDWKRSCDPPEYTELADIYSDTLSIVYSRQATVEEALNDASEKIDNVIANSEFRDTPDELAFIDALYKR